MAAVEEEFNRQLLRLHAESGRMALALKEQDAEIQRQRRQLLEYQFRDPHLDTMLGSKHQVHTLQQSDVCFQNGFSEPGLAPSDYVSSELAAQLLLEQETSLHLRQSVASLQERLDCSINEARKAVEEKEEIKKIQQKLEEQLEARKVLVLRLEQDLERSETRMKAVLKEHEDYKTFLTKKMGMVQQHLQRLRDDREELLSSRPLLEAQVNHF